MAVTPKGTLGKKSSDSRRASRDLRKVIYVQLRGASILLVDTGVLGAGGGGVGGGGVPRTHPYLGSFPSQGSHFCRSLDLGSLLL